MKSHIVTIVIFSLFSGVFTVPAETEENVGDLKYTFGEKEELPSGFFDATEDSYMSRRSTGSGQGRRIGYPACQDGSGGMCIPKGQCAPDKKPTTQSSIVACRAGQECCYGAPINSETRCRDRGGECVAPPRSCGNGPKVLPPTECATGEVCCIWVH